MNLRLISVDAVCILVSASGSKVHGQPRDHQEIEGDGWFEVAHEGSHKQFKHATKPGRVTLPFPRKDLPVGTLRSIEKQAGLKLRK